MKARTRILEGIAKGAPLFGPSTVHIDITNACNAACVTCWDHSPLLRQPRPIEWKRKRLGLGDFEQIADQLAAFGSVQSVIVSGMGDPLVHPDAMAIIERVKKAGWHLTILSNLLGADIDGLCRSGVDQLLVGVHGASPRAYAAFHPGWDEHSFSRLCRYLRQLSDAGVRTRHVQVINRDTAPDVVDMVRFANQFRADRVNYKLASLYGGTEDCGITGEQRDWLADSAVPEAMTLAAELGVDTNLDLFARQLEAASRDQRASVPIEDVGCFMGYLYTRITVEGEVLYCCNTDVHVGWISGLSQSGAPAAANTGTLIELWTGETWQGLRDSFRGGRYRPGCDKCGKFEQNSKWSQRFREHAGDAAWLEVTGRGASSIPTVPRTPQRLPVVS